MKILNLVKNNLYSGLEINEYSASWYYERLKSFIWFLNKIFSSEVVNYDVNREKIISLFLATNRWKDLERINKWKIKYYLIIEDNL